MKVQFYVKQIDEHQKTRDKFLFSEDWAEMMVNKQIDYNEQRFQVNSLEWMKDKSLKAVCLEIITK